MRKILLAVAAVGIVVVVYILSTMNAEPSTQQITIPLQLPAQN